MRISFRAVAASALTFCSLAGPVSAAPSTQIVAQVSPAAQGTLSGRVTDQRGIALNGATIAVTGAVERRTTTDANGRYTLALPPGVYTVTVSRGGFQNASNDVTLVAGSSVSADISLSEANLQSLQQIGRTSVSAARAPFNISETAVSVLPRQFIAERQTQNLTDVVGDLPGVVIQRTFSGTPNTNYIVRGGKEQTRVTIDGHPVTSGISGQWNANYGVAGIFQDAEVVKGAGLNGAIAGESAVGTVNLRTRDFTGTDVAGFSVGPDNYNAGTYNVFAERNFLKGNKLSVIVAQSRAGFRGPWDNLYATRINTTSGLVTGLPVASLSVPSINGLTQWTGDFSNRYSLEGELVKARYRFSEATSLSAEFLGLQGQYGPQGGSYGSYYGQMTQYACGNPSLNANNQTIYAIQPTLAPCTSQSTYTAPYAFGSIGSTVNAYAWFPNSFIQNNEPQVAAELRTTIKNDTLLVRPYTHLINRYISGTYENQYPGNGGGWYAVTNAANCQVAFIGPKTGGTGGASGPCFAAPFTPNGTPYVNPGDPYTPVFATNTTNAPVCSPTPPYTCFTTTTNVENDGRFGFGTPFSQPEIDRLFGYTISYLHPMGPNTINIAYDYRKDFTQSSSTDATLPGPGCSYVIGGVTGGAVIDNTGTPFQPNCSTANKPAPYTNFNILPRSPVGTPPTVSQFFDFSINGRFQVNDNLSIAIGNYFTRYQADAQVEDPAVLAAYAARGNSSASPVSLVTRRVQFNHYDPHVGAEYRVNRDISLRGNIGSSVTQPYASLISGFGSISIPNAQNHNYVVSVPNAGIKPEETVSADLGGDFRMTDGSVVSVDLYNNNTFNAFNSSSQTIPIPVTVQTFADSIGLQNQTVNAGTYRSQGLELSWLKAPAVGWGYWLTSTFQRVYYTNVPLAFYSGNTSPANSSFTVPDAQIFGIPPFKAYGQLSYTQAGGAEVRAGVDYEGTNNSTFGKPYALFDAGIRFPVARRFRVSLVGNNIFNYNGGTDLARNLQSQGFQQPKAYLNPVTGLIQQTSQTVSIQSVAPRTLRLLIDFNTGR